MPGIARSLGADHDLASHTVTGAFQLEVARGMAAAARDSSRLAKEALKLAGLGEARLVELTIALRQTQLTEARPTQCRMWGLVGSDASRCRVLTLLSGWPGHE